MSEICMFVDWLRVRFGQEFAVLLAGAVLTLRPCYAADPLLDFRTFIAPDVSQRVIREPLVSWLVLPQAESHCANAQPKDGYVSMNGACVYWRVNTSHCTIVTESSTTHSQLGHLLLHCLRAK